MRAPADGIVTEDGVTHWATTVHDPLNQQYKVKDLTTFQASLDVTSWSATEQLAFSLAGQNLLHRRHAEFGSPTSRRTIERGMHGSFEWHF